MEAILLSWSGGKDSALALNDILMEKKYSVKFLFTTISAEYNRISMHGVRKELLEKQAESLGIPVHIIRLLKNVNNDEYGNIMKREMLQFKSKNVIYIAFGDIFLEDVREYREANLASIGMKAVFPLWGKNSMELAKQFLDLGFKAIITSVDSKVLDKSFVGLRFDDNFLNSLPTNVDPCGENGEFHTFVFDGPFFQHPIRFNKGKVVYREERFYFIDLL